MIVGKLSCKLFVFILL